MDNNNNNDFGNFGDFGGEENDTQNDDMFKQNISSDPFAIDETPKEKPAPTDGKAPKGKKEKKDKKEKKGAGKAWIVILVVLVLIVGAVAASPLLLMKLGDSNVEKGDYKAAKSMYSLCFNLYGSKNRTNATKAVIDVLNMDTDSGINHALENGIVVNISYDLNGGHFINSDRQTEVVLVNKEDFSDFYKATKENYDFVGWHVERTEYNPEIDDALIEFSLKADFTPTVYNISYTGLYSDEQKQNPEKYTVESKTITLVNPSRVGYTFDHWKGTDIKDNATTVVIPQGSTGDRAYIAEWIANKYAVTYEDGDDGWKIPDEHKKNPDSVTYDHSHTFWNYNSAKVPGYRRGYQHIGWKSDKKEHKIEDKLVTKEDKNNKDNYDLIWTDAEDVTIRPMWKEREWNWKCNLNCDPKELEVPYGKTEGTYKVTSEAIELVNPKRIGYNFIGWTYVNDASTGADPDTPKSNVTTPQMKMVIQKGTIGHFVFDAKWNPKKYNVNLNANGGVVSSAVYTATYDEEYNISPPTKTGYTFTGWSTASGTFKQSGIWKLLNDVSVTAGWKAKEYTLSFNSNGGNSQSSKKVVFDSNYTVPIPTRTGYKFMGWYDASGILYSGGVWKTDAPGGKLTVTARWEPNKYAVNLEPNGGSVSTRQYTVVYDGSYTIPTPTRTGYDFAGWYNGSSSFSSSGTWKQLNNVNLSARWTAKSYKLSFDSNGGPSKSSMTVTYDSSYSVPSIDRTGYDFKGWYDSSGKQHTSGTWKTASDMKLTARWSAKEYTVRLDANGGRVSDSTIDVKYDSKYSLPDPYLRGYEFQGWYYGSSKFSDSGTWKETSSITLTAKWKIGEFTVTLKPEGGTLSKTRYTFTFNSQYSLPTPTRKGYNFLGWYKGTKEFESSGKFDYDDDFVLKAKWEGKEYEIRLDANGGKVSKSVLDVVYGEDYSLPTPERKGYKFLGWYYGSSKMANVDEYEYDGNISLEARWEVKEFDITLNANGGSVSSKSISVTYGEPFYLPEPERDGYVFEGWYNGNKRYDGGSYNEDDDLESDVKLTAQWSAKQYRIRLDENGGDVSTDVIIVKYGEQYSLPTPVYPGHKFRGWFLDGVPFNSSGTWKHQEDIWLEAEWTAIDVSFEIASIVN